MVPTEENVDASPGSERAPEAATGSGARSGGPETVLQGGLRGAATVQDTAVPWTREGPWGEKWLGLEVLAGRHWSNAERGGEGRETTWTFY